LSLSLVGTKHRTPAASPLVVCSDDMIHILLR
jgi:hypothetical protein